MSRFKKTKIKNEKGLWRRCGRIVAEVYFDGNSYSAGTHDTIQQAKAAQKRKYTELEQRAKEARALTPDDKVLFRVFVANWKSRKFPEFKPSMQRSADSHIRQHLLPAFGDMKLREITPYTLELTAKTVAATLAAKTRKNVLQTLVWILRDAHRTEFLARDVTEHFSLPTVDKHLVTAVPLEEVARIIGAMRRPYREITLLAASTGMRQGEVLALEWNDIHFAAGEIHVTKNRDQGTGACIRPKTDAGTRVVHIGPEVLSFLQEWRDEQRGRMDATRARLEDVAATRSPGTTRHQKALRALSRLATVDMRYLFPAAVAAKRRVERMPVVEPRNVLRAFVAAAKDLGTPMTFHQLRHTFASVVLAESGEAALPSLAANLGHSSPSFTLNQYAHMIPNRARKLFAPVASGLFPTHSASLNPAPCPARRGRRPRNRPQVTEPAVAT